MHCIMLIAILLRSECLEASNKGNAARFMNHSCKPNCHTQKWYVSGEVSFASLSSLGVL